MDKQQKTGKAKFSFRVWWKRILLIAVIVYCIVAVITQQMQIEKQKNLAEELSVAEKELKNEIDRLNREIDNMNTDDYIEKEARNRLGMIKEDEIVYKSMPEEDEEEAVE